MNDNGTPLGAGAFLKKYGSHCDYSIRNKEWDVEEVYGENRVVIKWISQGDITSEVAKDCLLDMLGDVVEDCADIGDNVTLIAWKRGKGDERHPQLSAAWDTYRCEWTDVKVNDGGLRTIPMRENLQMNVQVDVGALVSNIEFQQNDASNCEPWSNGMDYNEWERELKSSNIDFNFDWTLDVKGYRNSLVEGYVRTSVALDGNGGARIRFTENHLYDEDNGEDRIMMICLVENFGHDKIAKLICDELWKEFDNAFLDALGNPPNYNVSSIRSMFQSDLEESIASDIYSEFGE
jgi:hypothetical protein